MVDSPPARTPELDRAFSLQKELESADITILDLKRQFLQKDFSNLPDTALSNNSSNPLLAVTDVRAQQSFLRKLKFHYMEQHAKDKYVKFIVSPDEPGIEAEHNIQLGNENNERKRLLKQDKIQLAAMYEKIREKAALVDQAYERARLTTAEAANLTQQILDAKLALTRLRAAHPPPRLTISAAKFIADEQDNEMANIDTALQDLNQKGEDLKNQVKNTVKEVERLKVERAAKEEELKRTQRLEEDNRWPALFDWYQAAVSLHKSLVCLEAFETPTDNELRLTYSLPKGRSSTIQLIFEPETRQLAGGGLVDSAISINIEELVQVYAVCNDIQGLIRAILAKLRAEM